MTNLLTDNRPVVDNRLFDPYFDAERKKVLQRVAAATSAHAQAAVADDLSLMQNQLNGLTVSPLAYSFTATAGQTLFLVPGAATDQGELVLVFRNGLRLRPGFDYTVAFTLDPEVTRITLSVPATLGDIIAGVIYNIAVDSIGAVDPQARSDIATLSSNLNAIIDARIPLSPSMNAAADARIALASIDSLADVVITTPATNQQLVFNGTQWVNQTLAAPTTNLDGLTDVTISAPVTDQILRFNGTVWANSTLAESIPLQDLSNVTITAPAVGQVLKWNGSAWVNDVDQTGGGAGATNLSFTRTATTVTVESDTGLDATLPAATAALAGVLTAAEQVKLAGIATAATANATDAALRDRSTHTGTQPLSSLSASGAGAGQVPQWNGAAWVPATPATGGGGTGTVTSVTVSSSDSALTVTNPTVTTSGTISLALNTVAVSRGGTGAITAADARTNLGLGTAATSAASAFAASAHNHDATHITTGTLAVARGGTGTTTSTGTGSVVLSAAPAFTGTATFATITASGDITANSDARIKTVERECFLSLGRIAAVKPVDFTVKLDGRKSTGVVAQDIATILPRLVIESDDGVLSVSYGQAGVVLALNLARELVAERLRNDALERRLLALELQRGF